MYQVFNFISACPYLGSVPQPADCASNSLHISIQSIHGFL